MRIQRVVVIRVAMFLALLLQPMYSAQANEAGYLLDMGGPIRQQYNFVFMGTVTCNRKACPGALVTLDFSLNGDVRTETVNADENGQYLVRAAIEGAERTPSNWRLTAHAVAKGATPTQLEGGLILAGEPMVVIKRAIRISGVGV